MLLGLVRPTRGSGRLLGAPLGDTAVRARVGFLPEHFRFHGWLTGAEFLRLHARLYGVDPGGAERRIPELLELVGLESSGGKKLQAYSKGMLQRIGLAQALVSEPELIILDEPTSGLDPFGRRLVRDLIRDLRGLGKTVFINSHLLSEIEITCDRVAFIKEGRVVQTVDLRGFEPEGITVEVELRGLGDEALTGLARWAAVVNREGDALTLGVSDRDDLPAVHRFLVEQGANVYAFRPQRTSLEDLFVRLIGEDGGE